MENKLSAPLGEFKEREIEIINLMAEGLSNQEIADQLFITKETVRWYNKQIYSKLGTSRRTEAIALARDMGVIGDSDSDSDKNAEIQHTLPTTTGPFIGRDKEISELTDILTNPDIRLVSLIATGGMGKSRLSLELGHLITDNYEHGVLFIDLTTVRNPDDIAKFATSSMNLSIGDNQKPQDALFNYCREKELLLIFDNFEHVLSGASLLSDLLKVAPKISIIVSSRERLNLRVETVYYLQPVTQDADQLFVEVAQMMQPGFVINDDDQTSIDEIVKLVGGSPLALVLAATWVDTLSVAEIAEEIKSSLDFLSAEMGDMPERQRSIHAVIDPTWKRLNEKEQKTFMWASVFRGGFTRELFQQVTGGSIRTLQTLINRSLVNHGHGRRYVMHPLIYQYAREKLNAFEMLEDAKNKHLQVLRDYAEHHAQRMFNGHYLESLDALEYETDNIRAALDWSLQGHQIEDGIALILANGDFWQVRSRASEAIYYFEKAIMQFTHPMLHYWEAFYSDRLGQVERSINAARRLIDYGEANEDVEMLAYGQLRLGAKQNREKAQPLIESALANANKTNNQRLIANCLMYWAMIQPQQSNTTYSLYHQALEIYESLGDLLGVSQVTNNIAIQYYDDPERKKEAKELMEYSLQLKHEIGDRAGEARRLTTLSLWAMDEEDFENAKDWLAESRTICEELGEKDRLSYVLTTQGLLFLLMTDFEQAQQTFEHSLQVHSSIKDNRGVLDAYGFLCQIHLLQHNSTDARLVILQGLDVATNTPSYSSILIMTYANYLWYQSQFTKCVPIVACLAQNTLKVYSGSRDLVNRYILEPLIYRVQQHIGDDAWQQALVDAETLTYEQILQDMAHTIQLD